MLLLRRARPLRQLCRAASTTPQPIHDALRQVLDNGTKKKRRFDESVDLDVTLNVDPRKPLQAVRGVVSLPHGVGRSVVVAAVSDDPTAQDAAKAAGADVVGGEDLVDRVADGYLEFDACVATADMAPLLKRKAARVLGPKGLLPAAKNEGTLADDADGLGALVKELKKGRVKLRTEPKRGVLHCLLYTSPSPRDATLSRMPSSA